LLLCSQEPATQTYLEQDKPIPLCMVYLWFILKRIWSNEPRECLWHYIYSVFHVNSCVTSYTSCNHAYLKFLLSLFSKISWLAQQLKHP
jgi:hypothetical protein